jgi:hypothetical protein
MIVRCSRRTVTLAFRQGAWGICIRYEVFFALAARAFAAFLRLLLIMTIPRNDPTIAEPSSVKITGILIAQTRGGKRSWRGWPGSTNGWLLCQIVHSRMTLTAHHQQSPDSIVEEDRSSYNKHTKSKELVELVTRQCDFED